MIACARMARAHGSGMKRTARSVLAVVVAALLALAGWWSQDGAAPRPRSDERGGGAPVATSSDALLRAIEQRRSNVLVEGSGEVVKVLRDDRDGSRHQRFIVGVAPGRTVLVAHNIDLADRVAGLRAGDRVSFAGEFEWNDRGGVVHWTHHDPAGRRRGGWIEHEGVRYE